MTRSLALFVLAAMLAGAAGYAGPEIGPWAPPSSPIGDQFEACRGGQILGGDYDTASGMWGWTCGNALGWDSQGAAYFVECSAEGVPHQSCLRAGESRLINVLHTVGIAAHSTRPGGKVYLPNFPGKDHGIYVDGGTGVKPDGTRADFPVANQWWLRRIYPTAYAAHGPVARLQQIQSMWGVEIVGEGRPWYAFERREPCPANPTIGADQVDLCGRPRIYGTWLIDDRGRAVTNTGGLAAETREGIAQTISQAEHRFPIGGSRVTSVCQTTGNGSPACLTTTNNEIYAQQSQWITGAKGNFTQIDPRLSLYCLENAIGSQFDAESTTSFCSDAPMIQCWNASANAGRNVGGCIFDTDGDASYETNGDDYSAGSCLGFVDGLEYLHESKGLNLSLLAVVPQCLDDASTTTCGSAQGHHGYWVKPIEFDAAGSCGGTAKNIRMGISGGPAGNDFGIPRYPSGSSLAAKAYVTLEEYANVRGSGFHGVGVMPANYLGRAAPDSVLSGTTATSGSVASITMTITQGPTPGSNALVGKTLYVAEGTTSAAYRTISANTDTTVTWTGGNITLTGGEAFRVSENSCLSSLRSGTQWANGQDETACDTEAMIGFHSGIADRSSGFRDGVALLLSTTGSNKSGFDGWSGSKDFSIRGNVFAYPLRGAVTDLADGYEFLENTVLSGRNRSGGALVAIFGSHIEVARNRFLHHNGLSIIAGSFYSSHYHQHDNVFSGSSAAGGNVVHIAGGRNVLIEHESFEGNGALKSLILLQPGSSNGHPLKNVTVRNVTGTAAFTLAGITVRGAGIAAAAENVHIEDVSFRTHSNDANGVSGVLVVTNQSNEAMEAQWPTWTIEGVQISNSGSAPVRSVCIATSPTGVPSSGCVAPESRDILPRMARNSSEGVRDTAPWPADGHGTAASIGDCDTIPSGDYFVIDDDGACADAGADGTLTGTASTPNFCRCNGAGVWIQTPGS